MHSNISPGTRDDPLGLVSAPEQGHDNEGIREALPTFQQAKKRLKELRSNLSQTVLYSFKRFDRLVRFDSGLGAQGALVERVHQ